MTEETEPANDNIEQKLDELRANNVERLTNLDKQGYGMNPILQLKLRLDALTAFIVDDNAAATFEFLYESLMANGISEMESEVARLKLTQGVTTLSNEKLG